MTGHRISPRMVGAPLWAAALALAIVPQGRSKLQQQADMRIRWLDGKQWGQIVKDLAGGKITAARYDELRDPNKPWDPNAAGPLGAGRFAGSFRGTVSDLRVMRTTLTGRFTDPSEWVGPLSFAGSLDGMLDGKSAGGEWSARNKYGTPAGQWTAAKK